MDWLIEIFIRFIILISVCSFSPLDLATNQVFQHGSNNRQVCSIVKAGRWVIASKARGFRALLSKDPAHRNPSQNAKLETVLMEKLGKFNALPCPFSSQNGDFEFGSTKSYNRVPPLGWRVSTCCFWRVLPHLVRLRAVPKSQVAMRYDVVRVLWMVLFITKVTSISSPP